MGRLKIAFFGTSDRSISLLNSLNANFDLVLCVTKNDVLVGRRLQLKEVAVKTWAVSNNVSYVTIGSLKDVDLQKVLAALDATQPDYVIVADFSYIIPESLLEKFPKKIINIHFSMLPKYRGASPVQFAILNGDEITGITFHLVVRKMDAGEIIHQIGYKMSCTDTSGFLYDTLFELAARELSDVILKYHDKVLALRSQDEQYASYTYSTTYPNSTYIYKDDAKIDWKKPVTEIDRMIRAYNPWPAAWCSLKDVENNKKLGLGKTVLREGVDIKSTLKIHRGTLSEDGKTLNLTEVQPENKNRMSWQQFANGYLKSA